MHIHHIIQIVQRVQHLHDFLAGFVVANFYRRGSDVLQLGVFYGQCFGNDCFAYFRQVFHVGIDDDFAVIFAQAPQVTAATP